MNSVRWLGLVLLLAVSAVLLCGAASRPRIILRIHTQVDTNGNPKQRFPVLLSNPEEQIYVNLIPEATEGDLIAAEEHKNPNGGTGTILHFNHHAALNLNASTSQNEGKILVVILNDRVIYSAIIDQVISEGDFFLPRGVTPEELTLLQAVAVQNVKEHRVSQ